MHDGFYLRGSVGFGSLGATFDQDDPLGDVSGSGFSLGLDLMVGGSPSPGLAIGGALLAQGAFSVEFELDDDQWAGDRSLSVVVLGPFIDGFPRANKGWHLGGMVGFAAANIESDGRDALSETVGFGGAAWFGHDFWVADEWSVGPMFRLTGTLTRDGDTDVNASTFSALFLFTALHH